MLIIGCDYHPGFQQLAFVDTETGEVQERRLEHAEAAEKFYRELAAQGTKVRVGMEASGHARWFERLLAELNFELWEIAVRGGDLVAVVGPLELLPAKTYDAEIAYAVLRPGDRTPCTHPCRAGSLVYDRGDSSVWKLRKELRKPAPEKPCP